MIPFRLSDAALQAGEVKLANPVIPVDPQLFVKFLRNWVYNGETLEQLLKPGIEWGFAVMIFGLCLAWPADRKARRSLEDGRRVRGAEMVTRDEFNRKRKYNLGIGFKTLEKPSLREKFWIKYPYGPMIVIPEWDEPKHFLLMGDTGSGKSALMRQILWQLTKQQQTVIVYDDNAVSEWLERAGGHLIMGTIPMGRPSSLNETIPGEPSRRVGFRLHSVIWRGADEQPAICCRRGLSGQ